MSHGNTGSPVFTSDATRKSSGSHALTAVKAANRLRGTIRLGGRYREDKT
jgi:hypothetical protein